MIAYALKFLPLPTVGMYEALGAVKLPGAGQIGALVAIVLILAGVFAVGILKTRADESERIMKLAREEAAIERERAERLDRENAVFKTQPNLEKHASLLAAQTDRLIANGKALATMADQQAEFFAAVVDSLRELQDSAKRIESATSGRS